MKEIFEIFPNGVLIPFNSRLLNEACEEFECLFDDLLTKTLDQKEIRQRLKTIGKLLHILCEESFKPDKIIYD